MPDYRMGEIEIRFANLIWENEPIASGELVKLAGKELGWKKSTTYTILRRFCEKGIFQNKDGAVTSLVAKTEFDAVQSQKFLNNLFKGSLPLFLAAFSTRQRLTEKEVEEIQKFLDEYRR